MSFSVVQLIKSTPVPQKTSSEEVQDTRDIVIEKENKKEVIKKKNTNKKDEDNSDVGEAVIDILGGVLNLVNGALDAAEEIAGNEVNWHFTYHKLVIFPFSYTNCSSEFFT